MSFARVRTASVVAATAVFLTVIVAAGGREPRVEGAALALNSARVTIEGTSNLHPFTATSTTVRLAHAELGEGETDADVWSAIVKPGALPTFEVTIPVRTLSSPKEGLDKNMYKALKADQFSDIAFRLIRLEPSAAANSYRAIGMLRIAGVERETALALTAVANGTSLTIKGDVQLLMTDFGIAPPKAMLGMLKTDPKVTVRVEAVLAISLT